MNHPGFEAYHPINQDDERFGELFFVFKVFVCMIILAIILGIILASSWSLDLATAPSAIILPESCYHPGRLQKLRLIPTAPSSWYHPAPSSCAVILRRHPGAGSWYTAPSSWYHPAHGSQTKVVFGKITNFIFGDSIILGD